VTHHNTVLHQLLTTLPWGRFNQAVELHGADRGVRRLDSKTHLTALLFHQLSDTKSLRRLISAFNSHRRRLHHLGCAAISRSTLADANARRPHAVFSDLLKLLLTRAPQRLGGRAGECVRLIDSTTVRLTRLSANWARFTDGVNGAKAHIVYDPDADCPIHAVITPENVSDIAPARTLPVQPGATYVFDLGYYDYGWWAELDAADCRIVTRLKVNTPLRDTGERLVEPGGAVLSDRTGLLPERLARHRRNPMNKRVREIRVRTDGGTILRLVTNDLTASPAEIAALYKRRWAIELFFRWVKQALKIRHFLGGSENAVRIQIAVALIAFLLVRVTREACGGVCAPLDFMTMVKANLMHRVAIRELLGMPEERNPDHEPAQGVLAWTG
jgi:IS4 transposase